MIPRKSNPWMFHLANAHWSNEQLGRPEFYHFVVHFIDSPAGKSLLWRRDAKCFSFCEIAIRDAVRTDCTTKISIIASSFLSLLLYMQIFTHKSQAIIIVRLHLPIFSCTGVVVLTTLDVFVSNIIYNILRLTIIDMGTLYIVTVITTKQYCCIAVWRNSYIKGVGSNYYIHPVCKDSWIFL